ncbi:hypothetical protein M758_5G094100 [Ceratodon purpureus]|nr:hypothetical protein M758_5G094100 [Ceratodon purpureus]
MAQNRNKKHQNLLPMFNQLHFNMDQALILSLYSHCDLPQLLLEIVCKFAVISLMQPVGVTLSSPCRNPALQKDHILLTTTPLNLLVTPQCSILLLVQFDVQTVASVLIQILLRNHPRVLPVEEACCSCDDRLTTSVQTTDHNTIIRPST